ncbi:7TM-DISM domain-containing protein [Leptospira levettii]|uniref:7TM-DISM domain-containing protein n=1 Tax=Leptospira levettii TaxID=2023178 RepID=UPI00108302A6|nr:7TM diverse intracellular signaling domain-containing protein [Leptospira levettii]TGK93073.1 signaling protein [Leptospira levettii]
MIKIIRWFILLLVIAIQLNCYQKLPQKNQFDSYVDLSGTDWENSIPINLSSSWEFYWNQLLDPNDFDSNQTILKPYIVDFRPWTNLRFGNQTFSEKGYATYRKRIKIQKETTSKHLVIYFSHLHTSSKVFINGNFIQEKGKVSTNPKEVIPDRTNSTIDIITNNPELDIVLQIANQDFYHGGPRSEFLIASPKQLQIFKNKNLMAEIFVFGLIFASALYHLFFYFQNTKQFAFLYFSVVCFSFLIRIPFLNSKLYEYFIPVQSFLFQSILLHYINIITFLFSMMFLNELFKSYRNLIINYTFYIGAFIALFTPLAPRTIQTYLNFVYILVYLSLFMGYSIYLLYRFRKEAQGLYFMALALFALGIFCFLAIFFNYYGVQGGLYLISGYLLYVGFQSASLSKYFAFAIESRANIERHLYEESINALSKQRAELQLMVHDQLGANLTDLKVYLEKKRNLTQTQTEINSELDVVYNRVVSTIHSLRNQLLYIEDLSLIFENFVTGLHLTLLRRYSDVGREFDFSTSDEFTNYFNQVKIIGNNQNSFLNLFYLLYEVCTNDIKYGMGDSIWNLDLNRGEFHIHQRNVLNQSILPPNQKLELKSIKQRLNQLKGNLTVEILDKFYHLKIHFPAESLQNRPNQY